MCKSTHSLRNKLFYLVVFVARCGLNFVCAFTDTPQKIFPTCAGRVLLRKGG